MKSRKTREPLAPPIGMDESCERQEAQKSLKKTGHQNLENQTSILFCFISGPSFKSKNLILCILVESNF